MWKSVDLYFHYPARYNNTDTNIKKHGKALIMRKTPAGDLRPFEKYLTDLDKTFGHS